MKREKYKIISAVGITAAILLFVFDSAMALYDLGTGEVEYGITYFDRYPFSWDVIEDWGWWLWGAKVVWYALLIIPWIQYFNAVRMEGRLGRTLAAVKNEPLFSVFFTVFNIALVIGCNIWFIRTGEPEDIDHMAAYDEWWRDLLQIYMFLSSLFYIFSAIAAIEGNCRKNRELRKGQYVPVDKPIPVWYWVVSAIPFLLLALSVVDAHWNISDFL